MTLNQIMDPNSSEDIYPLNIMKTIQKCFLDAP